MADNIGYYKWFMPKGAEKKTGIDLKDYMRIEAEERIAETLGCDDSEIEFHHRWYDLDDTMYRAAGLSSFEFLADQHTGEWLLESYGTVRVEVRNG